MNRRAFISGLVAAGAVVSSPMLSGYTEGPGPAAHPADNLDQAKEPPH